MPKWNGIAMEEQPGMMQPGRLQLANPLITGPDYEHCPPYGRPRKLIIWAPIMPIIWTDGSGGGAGGMPQGITDGSNAPVGQVGELVSAENPDGKPCLVMAPGVGGYAPDAPWTTVTSILLTPGDWDVSGMVATDPPPNGTVNVDYYAHGTITDNPDVLPAWPLGWIYIPVSSQAATSFAIPVERRNITVPTTLSLISILEDSTLTDTGKEGIAYGYIHARRMR